MEDEGFVTLHKPSEFIAGFSSMKRFHEGNLHILDLPHLLTILFLLICFSFLNGHGTKSSRIFWMSYGNSQKNCVTADPDRLDLLFDASQSGTAQVKQAFLISTFLEQNLIPFSIFQNVSSAFQQPMTVCILAFQNFRSKPLHRWRSSAHVCSLYNHVWPFESSTVHKGCLPKFCTVGREGGINLHRRRLES